MIAACVFASLPAGGVVPPYGPPVASWNSDDFLPPYSTIEFFDTSTGGPTSWEWKIFGSVFSITKNASYYFTANGTYPITLTVTNSYGSSSHTALIHITNA